MTSSWCEFSLVIAFKLYRKQEGDRVKHCPPAFFEPPRRQDAKNTNEERKEASL
ncbi:hypothetical protein [Scytonema sp. PRP1]|uniref:hypothetical protein n=1 Tax=Scytonema sp. PRP1 TaxID=3120513 RepID=UPI00300C8132